MSHHRIINFQRINKRPEYPKAPIWLIGITDLVTLLLAFFILLFATAEPRKESWNTASESLRNRFGGQHSTTDVRGEAGHKDAIKSWKSEERNPGLNLDYLHSIVKKYIAADPDLAQVTLWQDNETVILSFGTDLSFAPGKTDLSMEGRAILAKLSGLMSRLPNTLEIVGHADKTPLQSDENFNSNWQLSLARAQAVAEALKANGYEAEIAVRGRGTSDAGGLPQDLPVNMRNELARRVDLRLHMLQP